LYDAFQNIAIGDADADNVSEIIMGNDQWGSIRGYTATGTLLWSIANPESGVQGLAAGDIDGDGVNEIIWGAGWSSTGRDALFVGDAVARTIRYRSFDTDGMYRGLVADVDADGRVEIIDLQSYAVERIIAPGHLDIYDVAVGQLDSDAALEIALLGGGYASTMYIYDGASGVLDYQSPTGPGGSPTFATAAVVVANIDADPVSEIIVGTSDRRVEILNGASFFIQWVSDPLDGNIVDLAVADIDNNGVVDLVVGTSSGFYVFNLATGAERLHVTLSNVWRVAATSLGGGRFAVATYYPYSSSTATSLRLYSSSLDLLWDFPLMGTNAPTAVAFTTLSRSAQVVSGDVSGNLRFFPVDGSTPVTSDVINLGSDRIEDLDSSPAANPPQLIVSRSFQIEILGAIAAARDLGGDGRADVLLQHSSSRTVAAWQMDGFAVTSGVVIGDPGTEWSVVSVSDLGADSKADVLLRSSSSGAIAEWRMNGLSIAAGAILGSLPTSTAIAASGDINRDGASDIIFQDSASGDVSPWQMSGFTVLGRADVGDPGPSWIVVGAGDVDGDGKSDLVLQHAATGDVAVWKMNGHVITAGAVVGSGGPARKVAAVGDSNGDARADIFLQDATSGDVAVWQMNGTAIASGAVVGSPGTYWVLRGAADYDGDGKADLLLQNTAGDLAQWRLNGTTIVAATIIASPGAWLPVAK
jgi:hypothetical protein